MFITSKKHKIWLIILATALLLAGLGLMLTQYAKPNILNLVIGKQQLSDNLLVGTTELNVKDIAEMTYFYQELVGLEILQKADNSVTLGYENTAIIRLISAPDLPHPSNSSAGLYHNAILFASRTELAQTLNKILTTRPEFFAGSSDHLVSEAFYFSDPENNGLELYFDKNSDTWQWQDGKIVMGSKYIDPYNYIAEYSNLSASPSKRMGHVHLKVGDIAKAKKFYVDILGLVVTAETPGALFVSDGKYHHSLGLNVWESAGASQRTNSTGLQSFSLIVETQQNIQALHKRLQKAGITFSHENGVTSFLDPWANKVIVYSLQN